MNKKYGTYLIEFTDDNSIVCGNNYKPWWQHAVEYIYSNYKDPERGHYGWRYSDIAHIIKTVKFSDTQFYDDGGLKWATPKGYDEVIMEVAKKEDRKPIAFVEIDFVRSTVDEIMLTKKLKEY